MTARRKKLLVLLVVVAMVASLVGFLTGGFRSSVAARKHDRIKDQKINDQSIENR
jgi:hypothetical protein